MKASPCTIMGQELAGLWNPLRQCGGLCSHVPMQLHPHIYLPTAPNTESVSRPGCQYLYLQTCPSASLTRPRMSCIQQLLAHLV